MHNRLQGTGTLPSLIQMKGLLMGKLKARLTTLLLRRGQVGTSSKGQSIEAILPIIFANAMKTFDEAMLLNKGDNGIGCHNR